MPDYIYLLDNRLTTDQQHALRQLRDAARDAGTILFLTGGAVRDLTQGYAVRSLEVVVHGNAIKMKKPLEKVGAAVWGEDDPSKTLSLCFPGTVRVDLVTAHRTEYPRVGKPVYHRASIQEYLRGRDFTANAMAISLNEGSYGLLMDPLNGAADIESRTLRLVSNYGFLEEPAFLIRATRYLTRLGWQFDEKTQVRFENAREEGVIAHLSPLRRGLELQQIAHEDDGLKILHAHEEAGWMKVLFPAWTAAKADEVRLAALHELAVRFELQGIHADLSAARMQLLTARLNPKDRLALQKLLPQPGFVAEWNSLDKIAESFGKALLAKENQAPSARYKLFMSYDPEAVLWLGFTAKQATLRAHFEQFLTEWPDARLRIPYGLLQEMRITAELPTYKEVTDGLFLKFIDGQLTTSEEIRSFLEPYSPPAPPPPVTIKRTRVKRGAGLRVKEEELDEDDVASSRDEDDEDLDDLGADEDLELGGAHRAPASDEDREDAEDEPAPVQKGVGAASGLHVDGKKARSLGKVVAAKVVSGKVVAAKVVAINEPESRAKQVTGAKVTQVAAASPRSAASPQSAATPKRPASSRKGAPGESAARYAEKAPPTKLPVTKAAEKSAKAKTASAGSSAVNSSSRSPKQAAQKHPTPIPAKKPIAAPVKKKSVPAKTGGTQRVTAPIKKAGKAAKAAPRPAPKKSPTKLVLVTPKKKLKHAGNEKKNAMAKLLARPVRAKAVAVKAKKSAPVKVSAAKAGSKKIAVKTPVKNKKSSGKSAKKR